MEYPAFSQIKANRLKNLKIWLVDDDPDLCEAYFEYLSEFFDVSFRFHSSLDALEALKNLPANKIPDVIMVDRFMPGLDGLSLSKEIAKMQLPTSVLMVSGDENLVSEEEAESLNIFARIRKPCSPVLICNAIYHYGSFKDVCEKISNELLTLCRGSVPDWEFFFGHHADLQKAFNAPSRKKSHLAAAIQGFERQLKEKSIALPLNSPIPELLESFRKILK